MDYSEAIRRNADNCENWIKRFGYLLTLSEVELALEDAAKALVIDHSSQEAFHRIINCHLLMGNIQQAGEAFNALNQIAPRAMGVRREGSAIENATKLMDQINDLAATRTIDKTLKLLDEALKLSPFSVDLLFLKIKNLIATTDPAKTATIKETENVLFTVLQEQPRLVEVLQHYYSAELHQSTLLLNQISTAVTDRIKPLQSFKAALELVTTELLRGNCFKFILQ